jgi:hypothetical protein
MSDLTVGAPRVMTSGARKFGVPDIELVFEEADLVLPFKSDTQMETPKSVILT